MIYISLGILFILYDQYEEWINVKRKILLILMITSISLVTVSCSQKAIGTADKAVESVVIDENTKETTNNKNEIITTLVAKAEKVNSSNSTINGKISSYNFTVTNNEVGAIGGEILTLNQFKIGTILDDKNEDGLNKISWEEKSIKGKLLSTRMMSGATRILDNDKVYKSDSNGELKEIKSYQKIIKGNQNNLNHISPNLDGTLDMYYEPNDLKKMSVIDVENDRYIEINGNELDVLKGKLVDLLGVEGDRVYVRFYGMVPDETSTNVGYFENNIYTEIFSTTDIINMETMGDMIYSNGRILFSGLAENKNSIWNYDIENKRLVRELDVEGNTPVWLYPNKNKDKIVIKGMDYVEGKNICKFSIAELDKNLEISKLTSVVANGNETGYFKDFAGWSDDGNEFYLYLLVIDRETQQANCGYIYYEVYKVEN